MTFQARGIDHLVMTSRGEGCWQTTRPCRHRRQLIAHGRYCSVADRHVQVAGWMLEIDHAPRQSICSAFAVGWSRTGEFPCG
jgi:hypothetical protein